MGKKGGGPHLHILILKPTSSRCLARHVLGQWILFWAVENKNKKRSLHWFLLSFVWLQSPPPVAQSEKNSKKKGKGLITAVSAA